METSVGIAIGVVVALVGSGGIVFTALRFNRNEYATHQVILQGIIDELQTALDRARKDRDVLEIQATRLIASSEELKLQVVALQAECDRLAKMMKRNGAL